ncbi:MAG: pyridoxal-dependent decarboxylase [Planctomycetota bacterium]|nr:pyridoxal-dependent decarboxylase [Planctomycetota bacterium]
MSEPSDLERLLSRARDAAVEYLGSIGERGIGARTGRDGAGRAAALPEEGVGGAAAFEELLARAEARAVASTGPRYFHYVVGGATPEALAADWFTSALDQVASSAAGSPLAVDLEVLCARWLCELFELPADELTGVFVTGATAANIVGLGAARQRVLARVGHDAAERGLAGAPEVRVLTGGFVHASVVKACAVLGLGRASIERFAADNRGTLDEAALARRLEELGGAPVILVGTAGEVNSGRSDPLDRLAELAARHGAWLHVDAAFGAFARVTPRASDLVRGIERADSIAADAHKWLNVPYDCGFALLRDRDAAARTFRLSAPYLPPAVAGEPRDLVPANLSPESSRRARALPVFATLLARGRAGIRAMVERHLDLAALLADEVRAAEDLELVDDPVLNVVPFRFAPEGVRRRDLDELNERLGRAVLEDGRVAVGLTRHRSVVCLRPAIANWRTGEDDVRLVVEVVRELGARLLG